ncbi:MAG: amidohydrolase family protein [Actinomycetota bacterium]
MTAESPFDYSGGEAHTDWLALVTEEAIDPELPIVDAHHHLWVREPPPYLLREYLADLNTGHNVVATVYAECRSMYRLGGPEEMKPVGESEFVAGMAAMSDSGAFGSTRVCQAMIGWVDVMLGADVGPVLDAHVAASGGRFRGVRVSAAWHPDETIFSFIEDGDRLTRPELRAAVAVLGDRDMVLDCWVYHTQLDQLIDLADAVPGLTIIANHTGVPVLAGPYRGRKDDAFADWRAGMTELAKRTNVVLKLGALPLRAKDNADPTGPPTSDDVAAAWGPWIETAIQLFGPDRCLFESNFPVHRRWCSYPVLWNGFKKITAYYSPDERLALFSGTASRVYRLPGG